MPTMKLRWRARWVVFSILLLGLTGSVVGFEVHRWAEAANRAKCANCLRTRSLAILLYAQQNAATQPATTQAAEEERLWALLRDGGHVVLMRHGTTTPGSGDPANFKLGDCSTQRNLSDAGRAEARRTGEEFRRRQIPIGRVLSSQWCRCLDTARLAFGKAQEEPALNSAFADDRERAKQMDATRKLLAIDPHGPNLVLVTHSTNITALTGVTPEMGEFLVLTPTKDAKEGFRVAGRLKVRGGTTQPGGDDKVTR
jgi:phosphohistidine phosphatase SixA